MYDGSLLCPPDRQHSPRAPLTRCVAAFPLATGCQGRTRKQLGPTRRRTLTAGRAAGPARKEEARKEPAPFCRLAFPILGFQPNHRLASPKRLHHGVHPTSDARGPPLDAGRQPALPPGKLPGNHALRNYHTASPPTARAGPQPASDDAHTTQTALRVHLPYTHTLVSGPRRSRAAACADHARARAVPVVICGPAMSHLRCSASFRAAPWTHHLHLVPLTRCLVAYLFSPLSR